jgi:hypothetical protein
MSFTFWRVTNFLTFENGIDEIFKSNKPMTCEFLSCLKLYGNNVERGTILSLVSFLSVNFLNMVCFCALKI